MANLSFGVNGPTMDFTVDLQVNDEDTPRILAYLASTEYGKVTEEVDGEEVTRDATAEEAAKGFAAGILRGLLDQTVRFEKTEAARLAAEAVASIDPIDPAA